MGISWALIKQDVAECFDLGKGDRTHGWLKIFDRRMGSWPRMANDYNMDLPFKIPSDLISLIRAYDNNVSGDPAIVADRITRWAGNSNCFLINYWEEIEIMREVNAPRKEYDRDFNEIAHLLKEHISTYKMTSSVWG